MILWAVAYAFIGGIALAMVIFQAFNMCRHFSCRILFLTLAAIAIIFPLISIELIQTDIDQRGQKYVVIHKMITFKDCALVDMKTLECIK